MTWTHYPVSVEPGSKAMSFGVIVPDLPGCFSAGDTLGEALVCATEAVGGWIDAALEAGKDIPKPSNLSSLSDDPDFADWIHTIVRNRATAAPDGAES